MNTLTVETFLRQSWDFKGLQRSSRLLTDLRFGNWFTVISTSVYVELTQGYKLDCLTFLGHVQCPSAALF